MSTAQLPPSRHRPIWFPAKRYGWGWGLPVAWQGWVVMGVWFAVVVVGTVTFAGRSLLEFYILIAASTAILIAICYARGERPRWRWGGK